MSRPTRRSSPTAHEAIRAASHSMARRASGSSSGKPSAKSGPSWLLCFPRARSRRISRSVTCGGRGGILRRYCHVARGIANSIPCYDSNCLLNIGGCKMANERDRRKAGSEPAGGGGGGGGGGGEGTPDLTPHPLVARLRGPVEDDEASPPNVVALTGYLGPSKSGDNVRLYTDLTFRSYYEIPRTAVRNTIPSKDEDGPSQVWVDAGARIEIVQISRQSVEAGYLAGSITGSFMGGAGRAAAAVGGQQPLCLTVVTAVPTDCGQVCLTVVTANPTDCGQACITRHTAVPTWCEPKPCDTRNPTQCPICLTVVTANPTDCGPRAGAGVGFMAAAQQPQQFCITLHTAQPTWCEPPVCITLYTARPTWCGGGGGLGGGQVCLTVVTANPTDCGPRPCLPYRTANPTQCQICLTVVTAVPTDCG